MTRTQPHWSLVRAAIGAAGVVILGTLAGCSGGGPRLTAPQVTTSPYDTARGEVLWAVAPLRNESGTREADALGMTDQVVTACEEIEGVRTVPLNRTLEAMRALKIEGGIKTAAEAKQVMQAMGVDAIVVGSVTAYDPYTPAVGMALALYVRPGLESLGDAGPVDTRSLRVKATGEAVRVERAGERPASATSAHLDAKNHQVLLDLKSYATGRHDPESALGWMRYTKSMPLYTEFAAHHLVGRLVSAEWVRLAGARGKQEREAKNQGGSRSESKDVRAEHGWARVPGEER